MTKRRIVSENRKEYFEIYQENVGKIKIELK